MEVLEVVDRENILRRHAKLARATCDLLAGSLKQMDACLLRHTVLGAQKLDQLSAQKAAVLQSPLLSICLVQT